MDRTAAMVCLIAMGLGLPGCSTGPLQENPTILRPEQLIPQENPLYVPQGPQPEVYDKIFQKVLDVVDDFWEIAYTDRYGGRIETQPSVAPGFEQPWKPGSPDFYQRLLANFQSIRHRCIVLISTAKDGGYFIDVKVLKELEDLPSPVRSTAGAASFNMVSTIERQYEVIEQPIFEPNWVPIGRDLKLEQVILERLAHANFNALPNPEPIYGPAPTVPAR